MCAGRQAWHCLCGLSLAEQVINRDSTKTMRRFLKKKVIEKKIEEYLKKNVAECDRTAARKSARGGAVVTDRCTFPTRLQLSVRRQALRTLRLWTRVPSALNKNRENRGNRTFLPRRRSLMQMGERCWCC